MGRPKLHDETTRRTLLDEAERLVDAEGLTALSLRRLAAATGLSTRAVYSTFGSKDALVGALGARAFQWLGHALDHAPVTDDPARDLVDVGAVVFRGLVLEHPVLFHIGFRANTSEAANAVTRATANAGIHRIAHRVERVVRDPARVRDGVRGFNAMTEGLAAMELRGNFADDPDPAAAWRTALTTFVDGLTGTA